MTGKARGREAVKPIRMATPRKGTNHDVLCRICGNSLAYDKVDGTVQLMCGNPDHPWGIGKTLSAAIADMGRAVLDKTEERKP